MSEQTLEKTKKKRRWGDRYDGRRVQSSDPFFYVVPRVMKNRNGSQVFFDEVIDISRSDAFVHQKRAEGYELRFLHIIIAAMVRAVSQKPRVNRFVAGKKIYARNYLRIPITIKRSMSEKAEEAIIQPEFELTDTLYDVMNKVNDEIRAAFKDDGKNSTAAVAKILRHTPGGIVSFIVFLAEKLDAFGLLPKAIHSASPFHGSIFVTDLGSLGIKPVYHHLYDFGTCSLFVAFGKKEKIPYLVDKETVAQKKVIGMRVVADERICDGFYYASALKLLKRYLNRPELLEVPPEEIFEDAEAN